MTDRMIQETRTNRWLVVVLFFVLLLPSLLGRLTGWRWQPWPVSDAHRKSAIGEALNEAEVVAQLSFAGL